jgi:hypothetical protein
VPVNIFRRCETCLEAGGNMNCREKNHSKLLINAGLLCSRAAMLGDMVGGTMCGVQTL